MKPVVATYRVQLHRHFTFQDLIPRIDYLHALNISHIYLSPVMEAASGSDHGYDVTDFAQVSRERGGEEGLRALDRKLLSMKPRMQMILDIVPNHMAASLENRYWRDVLSRGAASPYWSFFDLRIDAKGKIELPVLGDSPEALIAAGHLRLGLDDADIVVHCGETAYPVTPEAQAALRAECEREKVKSLTDYLAGLPPAAIAEVFRAQHYAFIDSAGASRVTSYRRFFDIAGLVAVRMEDPYVFEFTHRKLFELAGELKSVAGVRIDHVDGLADPAQYLRDLSGHIPDIWVEKILARHEDLRDWPCRGTTGYDFIDRLNLLMVDAKGFRRLEKQWKGKKPSWAGFGNCVLESKAEVLDTLFPAEVDRLGARLAEGTGCNRGRLNAAVAMLTAALQVYRVYGTGREDREWVNKALKTIPKKTPEQKLLTAAVTAPRGAEVRFFSEWQRLTGPAMAKGLEDRAHYRYTPLAALNEVGCAPVLTEVSRHDFQKWLSHRQEHWPHGFNAGTTHDTKRSEDVRQRLFVLTDIPDQWQAFVNQSILSLKPPSALRPSIVRLFLQTVLGTWPMSGLPDVVYTERLCRYMQKAAREAAADTTWAWPDTAYEVLLDGFVRDALENTAFAAEVAGMMRIVAPAGALNSLSALTLRILSAGIPDIYHGTESWNFTLVDPDNRGPVDFNALEYRLRGNGEHPPKDWRSGDIKLWLTRELLKIRRGFLRATGGDYSIRSVTADGAMADCLVALLLSGADRRLAVIVPRYPGRFIIDDIDIGAARWRDTAIALPRAERPVNLLTGKPLPGGKAVLPRDLFSELPVAVIRL